MDTRICIVLIFFCILVGESSCDKHSRQGFCGADLVHALESVCKFKYLSKLRSRKSVDYNQEYSNENSAVYVSDGFGETKLLPMESFGRLFTAINRKQRTKRGIYEECCLNVCSMDDLRSYCA